MSEHPERPPAAGEEHGANAGLTTAGAITYLHLHAADVRQAAAFYGEVFGWQIHDPDSERPSFDTPNGHLSGAWLSDPLPAAEPGLLPYIYVDHVEDTVARILDHAGEIVTRPFPEGLLTVATFLDPAGNLIGLWNDTTRPRRPGRKSPFGYSDPQPRAASEAISPSIQPELWVENASAAVAFYQAAFSAIVMHQVGDGDDVVAQLSVNGAAFWVTEASPSMKRLSPRAIDGTTGRTLLVVTDPEHIIQQAVAAGAIEISPASDEHGWRLGRIVDPFGHEWEIGHPLGTWPPA